MKTTSFTIREDSISEESRPMILSGPPVSESTPLLNGGRNKPANGQIRSAMRTSRYSRSYRRGNSTRTSFALSSVLSEDDDSGRSGNMFSIWHRLSKASIKVELKSFSLFLFVAVATAIIAQAPETTSIYRQYSVTQRPTDIILDWQRNINHPSNLQLYLRGLLSSNTTTRNNLTIQVFRADKTLIDTIQIPHLIPNITNSGEETLTRKTVDLKGYNVEKNLTLRLRTSWDEALPVGVDYRMLPYEYVYATIAGAIILLGVYILIIVEVVHRAVAAMLGSFLILAVLSVYNLRPSMATIVTWLGFETLNLLFGMMLIVGIFTETGFFDWMALMSYKIARGRVWVLLTILCTVSAVVSAFLDNVTTILLMAPVTIRLCEALRIHPQKLLLAEVIFSNIGGTATAVGDPPNVLLVSNVDLKKASNNNSNFMSFLLHLGLGSIFVVFASALLLRLLYRRLTSEINSEDYEIQELTREVDLWRRTAMSVTMNTREEAAVRDLLLDKMEDAEERLQCRRSQVRRLAKDSFDQTVLRLQDEYYIRNKCLLGKTIFVLIFVILSFIISSVVPDFHMDLGWIALLGAVWLLILSDFQDLEILFRRVEWSTLIFFAALFAFTEGIEEVGLIEWIGERVVELVNVVEDPKARRAVAILLVQWVAALVSSFVDNIPFTTAMIPVILKLNNSGLALMPLVWALAFGTCLGGNGTIIGASANVVAVGIAEQHGYPITFCDFFKIGFPIMLLSNAIASAYLMVCHVGLSWND